ncbi:MAG TPA: choice-of-anchor Q domain-containing protein, partial [Chthoniobacterales bacterium]|nr:choice-of-anchor Q domain-containing protein [Chthoniobacterales bacterium]
MLRNPCRCQIKPLALLCAFAAAAMVSHPVSAATRTVTNLNDDGPGSLRQTLAASRDGDTVDFAVTGTIVLSSSELAIRTKDLTIQGPGAKLLAVSGNNEHRVMNILSGARVTVSGLTIRDGFVDTRGGAIFSSGTLTLRECMVLNSRSSGVGDGGGIANVGRMQIERCTIAGNLGIGRPGGSSLGGGIFNDRALTISNSTVVNNETRIDTLGFPQRSSGGAGIYNGDDSFTTEVNIIGCTISGNRVTGEGLALRRGGGVLNDRFSTVVISDTIVAGNEAPERKDVDEGVISGGYNLIGNLANDGDTTPRRFQHGVNHDQVGGAGRPPIDPRLAPLSDNGGPTFTMALSSNSPAIDQGL